MKNKFTVSYGTVIPITNIVFSFTNPYLTIITHNTQYTRRRYISWKYLHSSINGNIILTSRIHQYIARYLPKHDEHGKIYSYKEDMFTNTNVQIYPRIVMPSETYRTLCQNFITDNTTSLSSFVFPRTDMYWCTVTNDPPGEAYYLLDRFTSVEHFVNIVEMLSVI